MMSTLLSSMRGHGFFSLFFLVLLLSGTVIKTTDAVEEFETEKDMLDFIEENDEDSLAVISLFRPNNEHETPPARAISASKTRRAANHNAVRGTRGARHPQIARTSVKHHHRLLRRGPDAHVSSKMSPF